MASDDLPDDELYIANLDDVRYDQEEDWSDDDGVSTSYDATEFAASFSEEKHAFLGYEASSCCGDGSLSIPERFLQRNPGRFQSVILSLDAEDRVLVYPVEEWLELQRRVFDAWSKPGMMRLRWIMRRGVTKLTLQQFGSLKLPRSLRKRAGLDKGRVIIVGYENHLRLCSEYHWKCKALSWEPDLFAEDLKRLERIEAKARARKTGSTDREKAGPQILLVAASEQLLSLLKADPEHLKELGPEDLEAFVAERLERMGFAVVRIGTTRSADGGIDFIVCPKGRVQFPYLLAVQVKSHRGHIRTTVREVRDFAGAMKSQPVRGGVLVTNTNFTMDARWFASQQGHMISLRDFDDLSRWIHDDFAAKEPLRDIPDVLELRPGVTVRMHDELAGRIYLPPSLRKTPGT